MRLTNSQLELSLGYKFRNPSLLDLALTHRSWANEQKRAGDDESNVIEQNERLEFVGDSILGLVISETLFDKFPDLPEGDLTLMKHNLVSTDSLADVAETLKLGSFLRLGKGEKKSGGRKKTAILADTLEAVIAAVYFDSDYESTSGLVTRIFAEKIQDVSPETSLDYKTMLQELLQSEKQPLPQYEVIESIGPSHDRIFIVKVEWYSGSANGKGRSIKAAETEAARNAFKTIGDELQNHTEKR